MYKSSVPAQGRGASPFKPLSSPRERPADLADAMVNGQRVPYIVRVETGTLNRAVYQMAYLHDPSAPAPGPGAPPPRWNGRLVYTFGGSCTAGYIQGRSSGGVLNDPHLSRGYAVASSSLNVFGNNCTGVVSAETLMMVKERFIETVGIPRHTIGWGGSGGAMAQYVIAQNYPARASLSPDDEPHGRPLLDLRRDGQHLWPRPEDGLRPPAARQRRRAVRARRAEPGDDRQGRLPRSQRACRRLRHRRGLASRAHGRRSRSQMDRWLDAIAADTSTATRAQKVVRAKPADLTDACWNGEGRKISEPAVYCKDTECDRLFPPHSAPRLEAGTPLADVSGSAC